MNVEEFISANRCDQLYHMSEKESWENIQELGLLSTSTLLDVCGYTGNERFKIESQIRRSKMYVKHPGLGIICIRDQIPMRDWPEQDLFLDEFIDDGVTSQEWLEFLNGKVFFWTSKYELTKMLCAWQYRNKPQWIIKISARDLLEQHKENAFVSNQNTGSLYSRKKRGPETFVPLLDSPIRSDIIELAVDYGVPNLPDFVISVDECVGIKNNDERIFQEMSHIWPQKPKSLRKII